MADYNLDILLQIKEQGLGAFKDAEGGLGGLTKAAIAGGLVLGGALAAGMVEAVKSAADFDTQLVQLTTTAGETNDKLGMVRQGILDMSTQVGYGTKELAAGMYLVESAGFHGQAGLDVLKASAMAARAEMADMATVADAVTSALNAYSLGGDQATNVTDILLQATAEGKMKFQDLAGSIGQVLPVAASAHVGLKEVAAGIATMTAQGTPAAVAATDLEYAIKGLLVPTSTAGLEIEKLGLSSSHFANELTSKGLGATLQDLTDQLGKKFPVGSAAYNAALTTVLGNAQGLNAVLMLSGEHAKTFQGNLAGMAAAGGKTAEGFKAQMETFNGVMSKLEAAGGKIAIVLGTALLPTVTELGQKLVDAGPSIQSFAEQMGPVLVTGIHDLGAGIKFLADNSGTLGPILLGITAAFIAFKAAVAVQALIEIGGAFLGMAIQEGVLAAASTTLGIAELFALWPLLLIAVAIAAVIVVGYLLITHLKEVGGFFSALGTKAHEAADALGAFFSGLGSKAQQGVTAVGGFFSALGTQAHNAVSAVGGAFSDLGTRVHNGLARIVGIGEAIWSEFSSRPGYWIGFLAVTAIKKLVEFGSLLGGTLLGIATDGARKFGDFVNMAVEFVSHLPQRVWDWLVDLQGKLSRWEADMIEKGRSAGSNFLIDVIMYVSQLPGRVWGELMAVIGATAAWAADMIARGGRAASDFGNNLMNVLRGLPGQVYGIGQSIAQGIINGITSMIGAGIGAVGSFVHGLVQGGRDAAKSSSPSRLFAEQLGVPIAQGIAVGILEGAPQAHSAMRGLITGMAGSSIGLLGGGSSGGAGPVPTAMVSATLSGRHMDDTNELLAAAVALLQRIDQKLAGPAFSTAAYGRA